MRAWSTTETNKKNRHSLLTDHDRPVLIGFCCFEGEEPQINQQSTAAEPNTPIIALEGASKSYGAVRASRNVSIALRAGEVRALAGENGAGKSTIVRMLAGVQRPDEGDVLVDGEVVAFHGPADARDAGVAVIYQEPTLFPDLSHRGERDDGPPPARVAAPHRPQGAAPHGPATCSTASASSSTPSSRCAGLSIADQQIVEIAKAL